MKKLNHILIAFIGIIAFSNASAQTRQEKKELVRTAVKSMVENRSFNFISQYAIPVRGVQHFSNDDRNNLLMNRTLITASLPYFGESYATPPPYGNTEGTVSFTSNSFKYVAAEGDHGEWNVLITPKEAKDYQRIRFYITADGQATMQVSLINRSAIAYSGYIMPIPVDQQVTEKTK